MPEDQPSARRPGLGPPAAADKAGPEAAAEGPDLSQVIAPPEGDAAEAFHQRARLAEDRLAEVLAAYRQLKADNEAYKERQTRNLERRFEQRRERLLLRFMDILDNLDRALDAVETTYAGEPLIEGLILVRTQLLQLLQEEGLERVPVLGLPYDPHVSEAVETREVDDPDQHHVVVRELLRGYRVNGRLVRASRVVVGEFPGSPGEEPSPLEELTEEVASDEDAGAGRGAPAEGQAEPAPAAPAQGEEPSLEDIVSRAEAQEALFPHVFDEDESK